MPPLNFHIQGKYQGHRSGIYQLLQYDDTHFLSCAGDGYIVKWEMLSETYNGKVIAQVEGKIFSMMLLPGDLLVAGDMHGDLYWIDLKENKVLKRISHHKNGIFSIIMLNSFVYTGGGDGVLTRWNPNTFFPMESLKLASGSLRTIVVLSDNNLLIGAGDSNIYLVDVEKMSSRIYITQAHDPTVFSIVVSSKHIFSGGRDAHINQYSLAGDLIKRISAHWFTINDLVVIPEHNLLVSASRDKRIRIWDSNSMNLYQSIEVQTGGHIHSVNALLYIPELEMLLAASDDRTISKFKLSSI